MSRKKSGTEAKLVLERESPDLILLDLMLPGISGEELLGEIRNGRHGDVPVLVLSAKNSLGDKVALLKNGADDYITKPFEPEEVAARVEAGLRRCGKDAPEKDCLVHREMRLYPDRRKALLLGEELSLTVHEFDILCLLMKNPERVYSREALYEAVWQGGYYGENNTTWVISAELLLPKTGPVHLTHLLSEIPAIYLISVACLVCALVCISYFEKTITGILVCGLIWFLIPKIFLIGGMRSEALYQAALWLPSNLFAVVNGLYVNTRECITAWDTMGGMLRCIASGGIGTLVFVLSGILLLKKKDLS